MLSGEPHPLAEMMMERISIQVARQVMLRAQGLDRLPEKPAVKTDVLEVIRRMGYLQIDTISVVARSPYFVLWSRLGDYDCAWLDNLLAEGALFEGWAHAYCFLDIEDYPIYRRRALDNMQRQTWPYKWALRSHDNPAIIERVLTHPRENGAVRWRSSRIRTARPAAGGTGKKKKMLWRRCS
jgi:uncharacterized protein YcaQ